MELLAEKKRRHEGRAIRNYRPYEKQRRFHAYGAKFRERALIAANQVGKTFSAGAEASYHATGIYPDWWEGYRITRANVGWCASETMEVSRNGMQRILLGRTNARGTGAIPRERIKRLSSYTAVDGAVSVADIEHVTGGISQILFKSYDQGRKRFQADTIDWGWCDEEPPIDIYGEFLTRTNVTQGPVFLTLTPLLGATDVVMAFLKPTGDEAEQKVVVNMTIEDAEHYTAEERKAIIASYPKHQRDARTKGIPVLGSGRIFPVEDSMVQEPPMHMPGHWPKINGIDFGYDHPTAIAFCAWDRDADVFHVYDAYRKREGLVPVHASTLKSRGIWIPTSWPGDGNNETAAGAALAKQYRDESINMLPERATNPDGSVSVEAGLMDMLTYMETGRFRVAKHLEDWFDEFRIYHRKDGKVVKERDDLMAATRYAFMMRRFATVMPDPAPTHVMMPVMPRDSLTGI